MSEIWKSLGYANYSVSDLGRVRNDITGKYVKPYSNGWGRLLVDFRSCGFKTPQVHTLVAFCFLGPKPEGMEINHKDGNPHNNSATNLEYLTPKENVQHAIRNGLRHRSRDMEYRKKALAIVRLYQGIKNKQRISEIMKIDRAHVVRVLQGKNGHRYTNLKGGTI